MHTIEKIGKYFDEIEEVLERLKNDVGEDEKEEVIHFLKVRNKEWIKKFK